MAVPDTTRLRPVVAAAIVDSLQTPTKLLATARAYPPELAGMFELPGGKVEPKESLVTALEREIREELNAEIVLGAELSSPDSNGWPLPEGRRMYVWIAETQASVQVGASHLSHVWCDQETIFDLNWLPADKEVIEALAMALGWS